MKTHSRSARSSSCIGTSEMAKVEFRYKDENKEERVLEYDTKTGREAWNLPEK